MLELHRFLLRLDSPIEFRDWLYRSLELVEPHLSPDDFLALLELDFEDHHRVAEMIARLKKRIVPLAPLGETDDLGDRSVLADQLQAAGDPRGELIVVQSNLHSRGVLALSQEELLARHRERLLGPIAPHLDCGVLQLDWHLGFISRATLSLRADEDAAAVLRAILGHPSGSLLRELRVERENPFAGWEAFRAITELLAAEPSRLTSLVLETNDEALWVELGRVGAMLKMQANLRTVELNGRCDHLGPLPAEMLSFVLRTRTLPREGAIALATSGAPLLERIELWLGDETEMDANDLAPLFSRARFPSLRHVSLPLAYCRGDLLEVILSSDLLPQLATLDLSRGDLGSSGAFRILEHAGSFAHLSRLDLRWNDLEESICRDLGRALPNARVRDQFPTAEVRRIDLRGDL